MPAVQFTDRDTYKKAFKIVMQVGGPFQGRGEDTLIVGDEQYQALLNAKLVTVNGVPPAGTEVPRRDGREERTNV
ncbi:MAG: hypothetical protein L0Z62_45295 [Gemmataceae bacterium]|nr:hypothetical protein [Gemmataceae bacterium]